MDELLKLLKQADAARHRGVSEAAIAQRIAERTQGQFTSRQAILDHLRQQDLQQAVKPGPVAGTIEAFGRGATFGNADELGGAVDALVPGGTGYTEGRDIARARQTAFAQEHPILSGVGNIAGSIGGTVAGMRALQALGILSPVASGVVPTAMQLAGQGAVAGALGGIPLGIGEAESLRDIPSEVAKQSAIGGLFGGAVGLAARPVAGAVSGLTRAAGRYLTPERQAAREGLERLATVIPETAPATLRGLETQRPGLPMVGDVNPPLLDVTLSRLQAERPSIVDALARRTAQGGARLADDVTREAFGVPQVSMPEARAAIRTGRILPTGKPSNAMRPALRERLYGELDALYPQIPDNPAAADLINVIGMDSRAGAAYRQAVRDVAPRQPYTGMPQQGLPGFPVLQETLRNLKNELAAATRAGSAEVPALRQSVQQVTDAMENAMPGFRAANQGYAQGMEGLKGMRMARNWRSMDARDIPRVLEGMGEQGQEAFKMAVIDDYAQGLRNLRPGANPATAATRRGDQTLVPQLRAIFGDDAAVNRYLLKVQAEGAFARTSGAMGGSATQPRGQADIALFGNENTAPTGFKRFWQSFQRDAVTLPPDALARVYLPRLTAQGTAAEDALAEIAAARTRALGSGPMLSRIVQSLGLFGGTTGRDPALTTGAGAAMLAYPHLPLVGSGTDRGY